MTIQRKLQIIRGILAVGYAEGYEFCALRRYEIALI